MGIPTRPRLRLRLRLRLRRFQSRVGIDGDSYLLNIDVLDHVIIGNRFSPASGLMGIPTYGPSALSTDELLACSFSPASGLMGIPTVSRILEAIGNRVWLDAR